MRREESVASGLGLVASVVIIPILSLKKVFSLTGGQPQPVKKK